MRPFAVTKCSAWLVSNESPRLQGSKLSYIEICYNIISHPPAVISLRTAQKNTTVYENPPFPKLWENNTTMQECLHMVIHLGSATGGQ